MQSQSKQNRILLIFSVCWLVAIGLFIRVWGLWNYYFSPDDLLILNISNGKSIYYVWKSSLFQFHPPFHFFFLHYMIKISHNDFFLRSTTLIPGLLLIFFFFFLGRKISGTVSGLAMAYMATFSFAAILLSQVIRPYIMLVLFLSIALWFFHSYSEDQKRSYLFGYSLFMFLALSFHYSAVIPLIAIGAVWLARTAIQKKPASEYLKLFLCHLPHVFMLVILSLSHLYGLLYSEYYDGLKSTYLEQHFQRTYQGFMINISEFYNFLFLPPNAFWINPLTVLGIVALWKASRRYIATIVITTFAITFILNLLKLYPFGGVRHSIYLFPFVAVPAGAALQYAFNFIRDSLRSSYALKINSLINFLRRILGYVGIVCLVASTLALTFHFKKTDYLRRTLAVKGVSWMEFPLKRKNYNLTIEFLMKHMEQNDVILSNIQTHNYFLWESRQQELNYLTKMLGMMYYERLDSDIYFIDTFGFQSDKELREAFHDLKRYVEFKKGSRIWLLNIGWGGSIEEILSSDSIYSNIIDEKLEVEAGLLYAIKAQALYKELEK